MNKLTKIILFLLALPAGSFAQEQTSASGSWWDPKPSGLYNVTTLSAVTFTGQFLTGVQSVVGYKLNPHLAGGGGIGIQRFNDQPLYDTVKANLTVLPVFIDLRYTVLDKKVSPVLFGQAGYQFLLNVPSTPYYHTITEVFPGFDWTDYYQNDTYDQGGFWFSVGAGVTGHVWKRLQVYGSVSYTWWSVSGYHSTWGYHSLGNNVTESYNRYDIIAYTHVFQVMVGIGF